LPRCGAVNVPRHRQTWLAIFSAAIFIAAIFVAASFVAALCGAAILGALTAPRAAGCLACRHGRCLRPHPVDTTVLSATMRARTYKGAMPPVANVRRQVLLVAILLCQLLCIGVQGFTDWINCMDCGMTISAQLAHLLMLVACIHRITACSRREALASPDLLAAPSLPTLPIRHCPPRLLRRVYPGPGTTATAPCSVT